jgi:hypothetical protein
VLTQRSSPKNSTWTDETTRHRYDIYLHAERYEIEMKQIHEAKTAEELFVSEYSMMEQICTLLTVQPSPRLLQVGTHSSDFPFLS